MTRAGAPYALRGSRSWVSPFSCTQPRPPEPGTIDDLPRRTTLRAAVDDRLRDPQAPLGPGAADNRLRADLRRVPDPADRQPGCPAGGPRPPAQTDQGNRTGPGPEQIAAGAV